MKIVGVVLSLALLSACAGNRSADTSYATPDLARAHKLLAGTPLIDGHNDLPWAYRSRHSNHLAEMDIALDLTKTLERPTHTDIPRMRDVGVGRAVRRVASCVAQVP